MGTSFLLFQDVRVHAEVALALDKACAEAHVHTHITHVVQMQALEPRPVDPMLQEYAGKAFIRKAFAEEPVADGILVPSGDVLGGWFDDLHNRPFSQFQQDS
jgi:hypothetical protein